MGRILADRMTSLATALLVVGLMTWVAAPEALSFHVRSGLSLFVWSYGLGIPVVALGLAMAEAEGAALAFALAAFIVPLVMAVEYSEGFLLAHQNLLALTLKGPVAEAILSAAAGLALLSPGWLRPRALILAAALQGLMLGVAIGLYSPGDEIAHWFTRSAAFAAITAVVCCLAVLRVARGPWWTIARPILGSWLVAASVLLAALPFVPKKQPVAAPVEAPAPPADAQMHQP